MWSALSFWVGDIYAGWKKYLFLCDKAGAWVV